jgi:hypothetical protein
MTSLTTGFKQSNGYFMTTATSVQAYDIAAGSGAGGSFTAGAVTTNAISIPQGAVLRDMGKTVLVGSLASTAETGSEQGTVGVPGRVFRKVQYINSAGTNTAANVANGVGGVSPSYLTFYIELPTLGRSGGAANTTGSSVVYVSGLPGLYV